jgi:hypothetical protein
MKGEKRPQMLLYLLVGALLLSTVLNFYFLLRLDARLTDSELEAQLRQHAQESLSLRLPEATSADTAQLLNP